LEQVLLHSAGSLPEYDLAISPDGRRVVRSRHHAAQIWHLVEGRPISPQLEHRDWVSHAAFSSDGRTLVTAARDGTARVWDAQTGTPQGEPLNHLGWPTAMALAPDGRHLALAAMRPNPKPSTQSNSACHIWDLETRQRVAIEPLPRAHNVGPEAISHLAFDPTGKTLAGAELGGPVWLWDVSSARLAPPFENRLGITALAPLSEGDFLIALMDKRMARIHRTAAGTALQMGERQPFQVFALATVATRPAPSVLAGFADRTVRLMRLTGMEGEKSFGMEQEGAALGQLVFPWFRDPATTLASASDSRTLLTSSNRTARQWRRAPSQALGPPVPLGHATEGVRTWTSDNGRRVLVGGRDGTYRLWDALAGRPIGVPLSIPPPDDPGDAPLVVAFSPDGRRMATCRTQSQPKPQPGNTTIRQVLGQELRTWDAETGQPITAPVSVAGNRFALAFSPDGRRLWVGPTPPALGVLDAGTLQPDAVLGPILSRAQGQVFEVSFSPVGRWLLTWSSSRSSPIQEANICQLWDAATGQALGEVTSPHGPITSAVFSPDGRWLATGHTIRGQTAIELARVTRLWALPSCHSIGKTMDQATPLAFSADGSVLLTGYNQYVSLREIPSCRSINYAIWLVRLTGASVLRSRDSAVVFHPNGRLLAIGTEDHYAQLIDTQTGQPVSPRLPHTAAVVALAFSPDGDVLLTGSADGIARFWHVGTGRPVGPLLEHSGHRVDRVAFAADGRSAVTWSRVSDAWTIVRHWSAPVPWTGPVAAIRRRVERMTNRWLDDNDVAWPLTAEEWHARDDHRPSA
jgi:WD40 repeat protein